MISIIKNDSSRWCGTEEELGEELRTATRRATTREQDTRRGS